MLTPAEQEAAAKPLPWFADRRFVAAVVGVLSAVACALATPAHPVLAVPCALIDEALRKAAGSP